MTIIHISDTHGAKYHEKLQISECDVLLFTGDLGGRTDLLELQQFLEWFKKQPARKKIFIGGNHDIVLDKTFAEKLKAQGNMFGWSLHKENYLRALDLIESYRKDNIVYLCNTDYVFEGIKFYGSPYSPSFHKQYWAFNADRGGEIKKIWNIIPNDTHVLLTHSPQYNILDDVKEFANVNEDPHVGCKDLANIIKNKLIDLKLHCFGHIHDNYGIMLHNVSNNRRILSSNGAILTNRYNLLVNKPLIITI